MPNSKWQAMPQRVRDTILDKHRDINTHFEWWDFTEELFVEEMRSLGIRVDRMYFSGFWSQGDGACFEGSVEDWGLFLNSLGIKDQVLAQHLTGAGSFSCTHSGRYYHENCTCFSTDIQLPAHDEDADFIDAFGTNDEVRDAVRLAVLSTYDADSLETEFTDAFKDHMRDLYKRLEAEYEYLTSDEAVLEALEANDMLDELIAEHTEELEIPE